MASDWPEAWDAWHERAGILEYGAGVERDRAERLAYQWIVQTYGRE